MADSRTPPLGLLPRNIYGELARQQRILYILAALQRYATFEQGIRPVPAEWIDELRDLFQQESHV